jgi:hypothetical protein
MNNCFKKINIVNPIWNLNSVEIPETQINLYEKRYYNVEQILPLELINKLDSVGLIPESLRLFVWPKNFWGQWHIDGNINTPRYSCINWIIKGSGVIQFNKNIKLKMVEGIHRGEGKLSSPNDLFEEQTDGHGCLINSAYCHRVVTKDDGRVSISLSYYKKDLKFPLMLDKLKIINLI